MKRYTAYLSLLALASTLTWAQAGADLYKKCAGCHGPAAQGTKMAPALKGVSEAKIVDVLTKGGLAKPPHAKPYAGVTAAQAKDVAGYIKTLK